MWDLVAGTEGNVSMENVLTTFKLEPQPDFRGTFSILTTCFVTLALCTWKIVHLNLPGTCPDASLPWTSWWKSGTTKSMKHRLVHIFGGHQVARQLGWLVIGLFAPELIAFAAFEQYWAARSLQMYMEEVYLKEPKNQSWWPAMFSRRRAAEPADIEHHEADKPIWTMTHSWYAVMGGYCYDLRDAFQTYLPDDHGRESIILSEEALRFVAEHEPNIIPRLTVGDVMDKSSAGAFVKIITLFQALWFSLQCIARMGQGLSISLLELTTFAHCVVGLIIGWLWLRKPLDISVPDALDIPDGVKEPHYLMAMLYSLSGLDGEEADEDKWKHMGLATQEKLEAPNPQAAKIEQAPSTVYLEPLNEQRPLSFSEFEMPRPGTSRTRPVSSRPGTGHGHRRPSTVPRSPAVSRSLAALSSHAQSITDLVQTAADDDSRLAVRMHLAQKGWAHYILDPPRPTESSYGVTTSISPTEQPAMIQRQLKHTLRNTLADRIPNFPRHRVHAPGAILHRRNTVRTHLGIALTGFLYGGLHLLAWQSSFASTAEQTIWRVAAVSLAASGLLVPIAHAEGFLRDIARPWLEMDEEERDAEEAAHLEEKKGTMGRKTWKVYKWAFLWMVEVIRVASVVGVALVGAVYCGLRLFIMLEALIGLGHLPPSAFEVVRWSAYVPHIS